MSPQDIMTTKEVSELLHVKLQTLYDNRWRGQSGCPLFRQGKGLFAYRSEIERWYKDRMRYV